MPPVSAPRREGFGFRRLDKPEEFRAVDEISQGAFGLEETSSVVSSALLRAAQDNGGLVLGAFVDIYLAGFSFGFLGWDGSVLYHYSHMTAVRPEYQNHHVGFRLKAFQREEVLKLGLSEVRWTFDPLQSRNALLNVRLLGGTPQGYKVHYYGQLPGHANEGLETDRLSIHWPLNDPRVVTRLAGELPTPEVDLARWTNSIAIVETEPGESGIRLPVAVAEPSGPSAHLEIPFDLDLVRAHEPGALRKWRHAVRDAFRAASDLGYVIDDFAVVRPERERRSFYFLRAAGPAPSGEEPSPADLGTVRPSVP